MTLAKESAHTLLFQLTGFVLNVISGLIIVRILGPESYGIVSVILIYPTLFYTFGHFTIGLGIIHHSGKRKYLTEEFAGSALLLAVSMGVLLYALFLTILPHLDTILYKGLNKFYLAMAMVLVPFYLITYYFSSILQSTLHIKEYNFVNQFSAFFMLPLIVLVVLFWRIGVQEVVLIAVTIGIAAAVSAIYHVRRITRSSWKVNVGLLKELLRDGSKVHLGAIATYIYSQANIIILNYYLDSKQVGYYVLANNLANLILLLSVSVETSLYPRASLETIGNAARLTASVCRKVVLATMVVAIVIGIFGHYLILLYAGESFLPSTSPLRILLPGLVAFVIAKILSAFWLRKGWFIQLTLMAGSAAIINLTLNLSLIPALGIKGAAWANTLTYFYTAILAVVLYFRYVEAKWWILFLPEKSDWLVYKDIFTKSMTILKSNLYQGR